MIKNNKAKCTKCGSIIESRSVHDFVQCKCKAIFIDGGREYRHFGFTNLTDILLWDEEKKSFEPVKWEEK